MKRVFTSDSKDQLFRNIDAVSGKTFSSPGNMSAAGIDASEAAKLVNSFFEDIFDTNKRAKNQITAIYNKVDTVDKTYKTKMSNQYDALLNCSIYVAKLASIMSRSTNINSGGFDPANISSTLSPTLTAIYMDRMCETTLNIFGNPVVAYNQEYLKRIMQGNAEDVPEELYVALIKAFTDMDMGNKAIFLENSYVETDRYAFTNYEDEVVTWEAGSVLWAMADLYQGIMKEMPVSMDILKDQENDYHKYNFNASLLMQMVTTANPQYTVNSMYLPSKDHPCIKINGIEDGLKWDYNIEFPESTGILPITCNMPSSIRIYQYSENIDSILTDCAINGVASMKKTFGDELAEAGKMVAESMLPGVVDNMIGIGKSLAGKVGAVTLIYDLADMFIDDAETNAKCDQVISVLKDGKASEALQFSASVTVIDGQRYVVNSYYLDKLDLNAAIRVYERDGRYIGLTAEEIEEMIQTKGLSGISDNEDIKKYIENYGRWGESNIDDYLKVLSNAFENNKAKFPGKELSDLSYDDMKDLEKDFPKEN